MEIATLIKWNGLVYALYYGVNLAYDYLRSRNRQAQESIQYSYKDLLEEAPVRVEVSDPPVSQGAIISEIKEETEVLPQDTRLSISKYHSAYRRFIIDDEGRIFVWTWERVIDGEGYYYDVFDSEGKYIVKIPLETRPLVLKKKKLYTLEEDDEGYQFVKRYKITWKY